MVETVLIDNRSVESVKFLEVILEENDREGKSVCESDDDVSWKGNLQKIILTFCRRSFNFF